MNTETHIATDALIALVAEAHASRRERLKPNEAPGYEGFIAEIRPTNFASDKEALLVKLVVPECKPNWFRWNTSSDNGSYEFGKRILGELCPNLKIALVGKDQLETRLFVHSDEFLPYARELIGQRVLITVKEGQINRSANDGSRYPDEWVPNPLIHKPMTRDQLLTMLKAAAEAKQKPESEPEQGSFA